MATAKATKKWRHSCSTHSCQSERASLPCSLGTVTPFLAMMSWHKRDTHMRSLARAERETSVQAEGVLAAKTHLDIGVTLL